MKTQLEVDQIKSVVKRVSECFCKILKTSTNLKRKGLVGVKFNKKNGSLVKPGHCHCLIVPTDRHKRQIYYIKIHHTN